MPHKLVIGIVLVAIVGGGLFWWHGGGLHTVKLMERNPTQSTTNGAQDIKTAVLAGGCFWCVEADLEKIPGVQSVVSGYSGGESENPAYENYASGGHREVVEITYDANRVSFRGLVEYFLKHIDPTDSAGSFRDRGAQYAPAIYYETDEEKRVAEEVLAEIENRGVFEEALAVPVLLRERFWRAEEYHQDYYKEHAIRYNLYRSASGRNSFIEEHWGAEASELPAGGSAPAVSGPWQTFERPSDAALKEQLTDIQYKVTQKDGTERAYENAYWDNEAAGIYVDVISGEPLFSSLDKYESGTGWPSFTGPLAPENIVTREDRSLFTTRTEVRSKYGDSHLGHVFEDGPAPTGLRYCLNSAALRFVPVERLEAEGYEDYLPLFE